MLRITTIQTDLIWQNKAANLEKIGNILRGPLRGTTDVVVLPEMFTTGFSMSPETLAEPMSGATMAFLKEHSHALDAAIMGSFICEEDSKFYNRLVWMQPDGQFWTYDKRHLFSLANEQNHYTAGMQRLQIEWRGWKICPMICYDLRFPVWSRNVGPDFYDVLIYVANWPERRRQPWQSLLVARAIENQAFVVGVNRVGADGNGVLHSGDTTIVDFSGEKLFQRTYTEGSETTTISKADLINFRQKFTFLADQDAFVMCRTRHKSNSFF
jgi:omega-amidase